MSRRIHILNDATFRWVTAAAVTMTLLVVGILEIDFRTWDPDEPENADLTPEQLAEFDNLLTVTQRDNLHSWLVIALFFIVLIWAIVTVSILIRPDEQFGGPDPHDGGPDLLDELWTQSHAMAVFALRRNIGMSKAGSQAQLDRILELRDVAQPAETTGSGTGNSAVDLDARSAAVRVLTPIHAQLAAAVAPAMPQTLALLLNDERKRVFPWLGNVRLIRMMTGLVVVLIPTFIALAISVGVRLDERLGLFGGNALDKVEAAAYLVVAAAMGAAFAGLFKAFRYINNLSYREEYESSYWVRFVLGIMAGLILAVIVAQAAFGGDVAPVAAAANETEPSNVFRITIPLLALVGGFSTDLVYRLLKRIIEAIETLVQGSTADRIEIERARADQNAALQGLQHQQQQVDIALKIREQVGSGDDIDAVISKIISKITGAPNDGPTLARRDGALGPVALDAGGGATIELDVEPRGAASSVQASVEGDRLTATIDTNASEIWHVNRNGATPGGSVVLVTFTLGEADPVTVAVET